MSRPGYYRQGTKQSTLSKSKVLSVDLAFQLLQLTKVAIFTLKFNSRLSTTLGGFDCRPVPAEIKVKLNRVRDQLLRDRSIGKAIHDHNRDTIAQALCLQAEKDEKRDALESFLTGDPRDVEITNLKIRLVRAEKERAEMATRATQDKRESQIKLSQAARILEQAQNLTEQLKVSSNCLENLLYASV